ncbi:hypothetical protein QE250_08400 [Chromatiaceae bacterium AAb-1]|nr:hypothetical protein [Chromatiaceae bacterium AAb-1]
MKTEQQLDQAVGNLPPDILPERDLWPGLAARLPAPKARLNYPLWLAAAVFGVVSILGYKLLMPYNGPAMAPSAELVLLQTYEQRKAEQLAVMTSVDQVFADWQQQMQVWDNAVGQVRYALSFYPEEPQLLTQLQRLYQQQLAYLQLVTESGTRVY